MKILILGKSIKFENIIKNLWPESERTITPWRSISDSKSLDIKYNLIFVCGYDYSSYSYELSDFLNTNVVLPLKKIKESSNINTDIIYIMTDLHKKNYTYSRYLYAKYLLAQKLIACNDFNSYILVMPTILNKHGQMDSFGPGNRILIFMLVKLKIIKVVTPEEVLSRIENYKSSSAQSIFEKKPKLLNLKRTIMIDRLLRLVIG